MAERELESLSQRAISEITAQLAEAINEAGFRDLFHASGGGARVYAEEGTIRIDIKEVHIHIPREASDEQ